MKHPIKINGKKYRIKSIDELTTAEFCEMANIEGIEGKESYIKYVAWQTGVKIEDAFFAVTDKRIEVAIGQIPDISKMKRPDCYDYTKLIDTVGQRHQVEDSELKGMELLVFCLAVAQARSNNIDDVEKLKQEYMKRPYVDVIPAGFFFFKNLARGKNSATMLSKWRLYLTKIRNLKNKLAKKHWRNLVMKLKLRHL